MSKANANATIAQLTRLTILDCTNVMMPKIKATNANATANTLMVMLLGSTLVQNVVRI